MVKIGSNAQGTTGASPPPHQVETTGDLALEIYIVCISASHIESTWCENWHCDFETDQLLIV